MRKITYQVLIAALAGSQGAYGGGFQVFAHGARAVGSAYAEQASRDDPSTAWWNPAAYGFADRAQFAVAAHALAPNGEFSNAGATTFLPPPQGIPLTGNNGGRLNDLLFIANAYYTRPLTERLAFGLAVTQPFGLSTDYESGWVGRYYALQSKLLTLDIGPSLAIKASDQLSVALGLDAQYAKADLSNAIDFSSLCLAQAALAPAFALQCAGAGLTVPGNPARDGKATIAADSWGWGWNLSAAYAPRADTLLSLTYRSKVSHRFRGDARFSMPADLPAAIAAAPTFTDTSARVDVDLPESLYLSFRTALTSQLDVDGSVTYTRWSRLGELRARLGNGSPDVVTPLDWKDSTRYSLGASYSLSEAWRLRAGLSYDESPANDATRTPIIPDASNTTLAVGATYRPAAGASIDIGYAHVFVRDAPIRLSSPAGGNLVGTFSSPRIDLISVQYTQRF